MDPVESPAPADGMRLAVLHRTTFHYGAPVVQSLNTLHLEPRTFPCQKTLSALIRVLPATRLKRFNDLFDNIIHHFELPHPHVKLEIESRIRVHNLPLAVSAASRTATVEDYRDPSLQELTWPYMQDCNRVVRIPEVWRRTVDVTRGVSSVYDQACAVMAWIHDEFRYEPGSTAVHTDFLEAFELRSGVCQDYTHVMLGMYRAIGVAARHASGYLTMVPRTPSSGPRRPTRGVRSICPAPDGSASIPPTTHSRTSGM